MSTVTGHPSISAFSYYEKLNYDPSVMLSQHARVTREVGGRGHDVVTLNIQAFNRYHLTPSDTPPKDCADCACLFVCVCTWQELREQLNEGEGLVWRVGQVLGGWGGDHGIRPEDPL